MVCEEYRVDERLEVVLEFLLVVLFFLRHEELNLGENLFKGGGILCGIVVLHALLLFVCVLKEHSTPMLNGVCLSCFCHRELLFFNSDPNVVDFDVLAMRRDLDVFQSEF